MSNIFDFFFFFVFQFTDASFGMCTDLSCSGLPSGTPFEVPRIGISTPNLKNK